MYHTYMCVCMCNDKAIDDYTKAVQLDSSTAYAYYNRDVCTMYICVCVCVHVYTHNICTNTPVAEGNVF
jgi:hypothetical protein